MYLFLSNICKIRIRIVQSRLAITRSSGGMFSGRVIREAHYRISPYSKFTVAMAANAIHAINGYNLFLVTAEECMDWALGTPRNGVKDCVRNGGDSGWICTLTCETDKFFYDDLTTSRTFSCSNNGAWSPAPPVPDCIGEMKHLNQACPNMFFWAASPSHGHRVLFIFK